MSNKVYRLYCAEIRWDGKRWGREFGIDYPTLEEARRVKEEYQKTWGYRYFIRAAKPRYDK